MLPATTIIVIAARISHPTASLNAAQVIASTPIRVRVSPWSARIRARTGNAVMLIADPMNSANGSSATPPGAYGYHATTATALPSANGTAMLTTLMTSAIRPTVFSVSISSRQPTRNMNSDDADLPEGAQRRQRRGRETAARHVRRNPPEQRRPEQEPGDHLRHDGRLAQASPRSGVARRERTRMTAI